jgi:ATP-dependent Lon protease
MGLLTKDTFLLFPIQDIVVFPGSSAVISLNSKSDCLPLVEKAMKENRPVFCLVRKNKEVKKILREEDFFEIGTVCNINQKTAISEGDFRLLLLGIEKRRLNKLIYTNDSYLECSASSLHATRSNPNPEELENVKKTVLVKARELLHYFVSETTDVDSLVNMLREDANVLYVVTNLLNIDMAAKQSILEEKNVLKQYIKLEQFLEIEKNLLNTEKKLNCKIYKKIQEHQKKFFLREKLKVIRSELNEDEEENSDEDNRTDIGLLRKRLKSLKVSGEVKEKFNQELKKLEIIPAFSPEYSSVKNYLNWILDLPWNIHTVLKNDLKTAEETLNRDHYGLEDVKERILEFIAVFQKTKKLSGSILCLVGPPGVGKTSLAKSIAEATNRRYVKISLGGMRDEAEIRGHRRTYVGAMPGKLLQSLKRVKTNNPLILLDELDKMGSDFHGDPAAAMLEVLDPEQNNSFNDHFLELEYDLSQVMFIATANNLHQIPLPLQDRMEVIKLSGYTEEEKIQIALRHLIPKQLHHNGLTEKELLLTNRALVKIIRNYTCEAGVRNLEREIEKLMRKITRQTLESNGFSQVVITERDLKKYLGVEKNDYNEANKESRVGVSTGLAYTEVGGDLLYLEALKFDGTGKLLITGKLGDIMKESVETAFSYVRSKARDLHINSKTFNKYDFHLHVPEGAIPKDGPSAGVAIATALMSSLANYKVRSDTATTGEITLTGKVLPIGGLREKLLAALRGNIKHVILPKKNVKDLEKVPSKIMKKLNLIPIETIEEAFRWLMLDYSC